MTDPAALRHVALLSVTPSAFAQIRLRSDAPVLTLGLRDIVAAIDRCRGMHTLCIRTTDGAFWAQLSAREFLDRARVVLAITGVALSPAPAVLLEILASGKHSGVKIELPVATARPAPPQGISAPKCWRVPHPYCFDSRLFWPSPAVTTLNTELFASPALMSLIEACRNTRAIAVPPLLGTVPLLHAALQRAPFLFFLLASLASNRVRARWTSQRLSIAAPHVWAYALHMLLLRAVDIYWTTDALAAHGVTGIPGLRVSPLPTPRIFCMLPTPAPEDASKYVVPEIHSQSMMSSTANMSRIERPIALTANFPRALHLSDGWMELETAEIAVAASRGNCEGVVSQIVYDTTDKRWFLVTEFSLDEFIESRGDHTLVVPIESRRVCRRLGFFRENCAIPPGSVVLETREWSADIGAPVVAGIRMMLVDLAPGEYVDQARRLSRDHTPERWWPLVSSRLLLHPLRSEVTDVYASGHWWRCSKPGPSVCLDPDPSLEEVRTVLGFQIKHASVTSPPATGLWLCSPPVFASMPAPVPRWHQCRLGCQRCSVSNAVAFSGDAAVVCRQELACVLWWHWHRFAEHMLCESDRATELGTRWFQLECLDLHEALASAAPAPPPPAPAPATVPVVKVTPVLRLSTGGRNGVTLRDGSTWDVNSIVAECCGPKLQPLEAHVIYLLWCINDDSAKEYDRWVRVGQKLYLLDPDSSVFKFAWQWWSRKYGDNKYAEDKDFGAHNTKWEKLGSMRGGAADLSRCMLGLASAAKSAQQGKLVYTRELVTRAINEFWDDGQRWWPT